MTNQIITEKNIPCELTDGTTLRSDIYRPDDEGIYPVLMLRLPYDKEAPRYFKEYLDVPRMVHAGYVVILQDVRGRFASEGEFYPFIHEEKDGYEAVEWAANLPFSNGKVGMFGMSYHGYTQLAAAAAAPPSLKAIAPVMTMGDPFADISGDKDGPNALGKLQTWVLGSIVEDQLKRKKLLDEKKFQYYFHDLKKWLSQAPANQWKPMKDLDPDSFYFDFMHDHLPKEWKAKSRLYGRFKASNIPALFIGGWFDGLLQPTLKMYHSYHGPKMLWIGPWTHEAMTGQAGEKFYPEAAENIGVDQMKDPTELHIKWFDHWLKQKPLPIEKEVHLYMLEENKWKAYSKWPKPKKVKQFYLYSEGKSQTKHGDGKLLSHPSALQTKSAFKLDPNHPVPTIGGGTLVEGYESGVFEISHIQERCDVLVYTTDSFKENMKILGTVKAMIWGSAPSPLFDVSLRLSDVDSSGHVFNIIDTFHRKKVKAVNEPFCLELDIGTTAYMLKKGHCLRLDIAASNAPKYDVNLNNGTTTKTNTKGKTAIQHIFHGGNTASKILVPFVTM